MIRTAGQSLSVLLLAAGLIPAGAQSKAPADAVHRVIAFLKDAPEFGEILSGPELR